MHQYVRTFVNGDSRNRDTVIPRVDWRIQRGLVEHLATRDPGAWLRVAPITQNKTVTTPGYVRARFGLDETWLDVFSRKTDPGKTGSEVWARIRPAEPIPSPAPLEDPEPKPVGPKGDAWPIQFMHYWAALDEWEKGHEARLEKAWQERNYKLPVPTETGDLPVPESHRIDWEGMGALLDMHYAQDPKRWVMMFANHPNTNPARYMRSEKCRAFMGTTVETYTRLAKPRRDGLHPGYEIWGRLAW